MLKAINVNFRYDQKLVLHDVNVNFAPGNFYVILGPNGSGKSSLLKLLSGDLKPPTGKILLFDKELHNWSIQELATQRAFLQQSNHIPFNFTVTEVITMGRYPYRFQNADKEQEILNIIIDKLDLKSIQNNSYLMLSGGEQQRVHIARTFAQLWGDTIDNKVLLLDEPIANLDLAHQHLCLRMLKNFAEQGAIVVTSMHDLNLAMQYSDEAIMLSNGSVIAQGNSKEVLDATLIKQAFNIEASILPIPKSNKHYIHVESLV